MVLGWKTAVAAVAAGVGFHALNDFRPVDTYLPVTELNPQVEQHFRETYYQARALFRQRAKDSAHATLHTLPLDGLVHLDLTIDVAVLPGASDRVFLHLSGTHGVEGFTGSAIQSAILQQSSNLTDARTGPTVVLVHALNPFGFAQLRRVNEHNVDLNRNYLSPEEFTAAAATDPNAHGYVDIYDVINPPPLGPPWRMHLNYITNLGAIAMVGWGNLKKAMVSATYHFPQGVFYGGAEKQPSLVALESFLQQEIGIEQLKALTVLDVHTGLGPAGVDTILLAPSCDAETGLQIFQEEDQAGYVASFKPGSSAVTDGYAGSTGYVVDGIAQLVPAELRAKVLTIGQEFGTVPTVFVTKALMEENAFFHHAPTRRLPFAERLRDVFYLHQSPSWKQSILDRGLVVFNKLYAQASSA